MKQGGLFDQVEAEPGDQVTGIRFRPEFSAFRRAARSALEAGRTPGSIWWIEDHDVPVEARDSDEPATLTVPREFLGLARDAACHCADDRWALLYQLLWRLTHGEPHLMALGGDPDVVKLNAYVKSVHRDLHKMKAFVRFKRVACTDEERYVAWFEPQHHIVSRAAAFFTRRFTNMRWSLLTPVGCAHWEGSGKPVLTEGIPEASVPADQLDDLWQTYYRHIFNPARVKTEAMRSEMPQKYWKHLPEAAAITDLLIHADGRVNHMLEAEAPGASLQCGERPATYSQVQNRLIASSQDRLERVAAGVRICESCDLWQSATQAVPGEGPVDARIMMIGEQPGDQEDLAGRPFQGPAGQLLDELLAELSVDRAQVYLTNAVKHFRFRTAFSTPAPLRGRGRRLHESPRMGHIQACRRWLLDEIDAVQPEVLICLGVTAASAVAGRRVQLSDLQGRELSFGNSAWFVTMHPAAVLRASEPAGRRQQLRRDLQRALQR